MVVHAVSNAAEWEKFVAATKGSFGGKGMIVDFSASWCAPCKVIAPVYEALSDEFPDFTFLKVDVDEVQEVAQTCGVKAMPTFQTYYDGVKVDETAGADKNKIRAMLVSLASMTPAMGTGHKLSNAPSVTAGEETPEQRRARMAAAAEARFAKA